MFISPFQAHIIGHDSIISRESVLLVVVGASTFLIVLAVVVHRLRRNPLYQVPGPFFARCNSLFLHTICFLGIEARVSRYYHQKYQTKVLLLAPNSVSISTSKAIKDVYIARGGFPKDARYTNFNLGPIVSIFSSTDNDYRDVRAKAVAPLFAPVRLRAASKPDGVIGKCIQDFLDQFNAFKSAGLEVDIVDLCARLSIDVVTEYLLGERYGGLDEHKQFPLQVQQTKKLSANPFIHAIVGFSRFSLLPKRLFQYMFAAFSWWNACDESTRSFIQLDQFITRIIDWLQGKSINGNSSPAPLDSTYPGYLLKAGISPGEVAAQSKAIVFAGGDSTAVMLATILFHLVQNPDVRARLLNEIRSGGNEARTQSQMLPYLRAVVKEGLRLGMANPTRLTRVVPATGVHVEGVFLPPGTVVGCAAYMLHHDPEVFPNPFVFHPERWLGDGPDELLRRIEMDRNMIHFGAGLRSCLGKNLAQQQLYDAVLAVVDNEVLEGAQTCQPRIEMIEWFNGEIKGHHLDIRWLSDGRGFSL